MAWKQARRPTIASLTRREAAAAVDALFFLLLAFLTRHARDLRSQRRWDAAITALDAAYTIGLTTWFGQTPGQMLVGVRVVDARSWERPRWSRSAIRWAVAGLPYPLVTLLPVLRSVQAGRRHHQFQSERGDGQLDDESGGSTMSTATSQPFTASKLRVLAKAFNAADLLLATRDPERRGVGDRAAGTLVIEARRGRSTG